MAKVDAHEIQPGSSGASLVDSVVRRLPDNAHVVLATRHTVPAALSRLRAADRLLVLLPKDAADQLSKLKAMKPFAKSSVGILFSMVTPSRAFRGLPVTVPDSLKWLRVSVTPKPKT